jgi:hypothetical protein
MLRNLDNNQLLMDIKNLVKEEKRITQNILDYLAEVEYRRLYALRGYPSLFEFCVKELGYSESSAFRRISAMRVIKTIPEAKTKLKEGSVNLSTLSQLQSFIKKDEKIRGVKLDKVQKRDLLLKIENKSQMQCEREFVKISPEIIKTKESQRPVTDALTEIKFMASKELMEKLERLQNLLSHRDMQGIGNLIEELADRALKKFQPREIKSLSKADGKLECPVPRSLTGFELEVKSLPNPQAEAKKHIKSETNSKPPHSTLELKTQNSAAEVHNDTTLAPSSVPASNTLSTHAATSTPTVPSTPTPTPTPSPTATPTPSTKPSRYIPQHIKNTVWRRDQGQCQYVDPLTKRKCGSKSHLEFDHRTPFATGGTTTTQNIRLLCKTHNQLGGGLFKSDN